MESGFESFHFNNTIQFCY